MRQDSANSKSSWIPVREVARRLEQDASPKRRAEVAAILGTAFSLDALSQVEQPVALQIFERLARDVEVEVRRALSEHIKSCPLLPRSLARKLAEDVEAVALPILKYATVLCDEDLVAIVAAGSTVKQTAIAGRETLSETVADALVGKGDVSVVQALLANPGAEIGENAFDRVLESFGDDTSVQSLLVDRPSLPITVTEQLVGLVSGALKTRLVGRHGLPDVLAEQLVEQGRERALLQGIPRTVAMRDLEGVAARLQANGGLTATLLLRALCTGKFDFFMAGAAALARVPTINVRALLHNFGETGFRRLYEKTGLPEDLRAAFWIALEVALEVRRSTATGWDKADTARIVARLVRSYDYLSPDGIESVLCQLQRRCLSEAAKAPVSSGAAQGSPYLSRPLRDLSAVTGPARATGPAAGRTAVA